MNSQKSDSGRRPGRWDWACSRIFMLAAFLCFFANPTEEYTIFGAAASAAVLGFAGRLLRSLLRKKSWQNRPQTFAIGFALMLGAQLLLFVLASGQPADLSVWLAGWSRLPGSVSLILGHWRPSVLVMFLCADLAILAAVRASRSLTVFLCLSVLVGISPWLLIPQPGLMLMPAVSILLLYAGGYFRRARGKKQRPAWQYGLAAAAVFLLYFLLTGSTDSVRQALCGVPVLDWLLCWLNSLKNSFADGMFGWGNSPALLPFSQNGWALRLQNTIYPGSDRFGWYALLAQGAWLLLLGRLALGRHKSWGRESRYALLMLALLPFDGGAAVCAPVFLLLPWLAVKAAGAKEPGAEKDLPKKRRAKTDNTKGKILQAEVYRQRVSQENDRRKL